MEHQLHSTSTSKALTAKHTPMLHVVTQLCQLQYHNTPCTVTQPPIFSFLYGPRAHGNVFTFLSAECIHTAYNTTTVILHVFVQMLLSIPMACR